MACNSVPQSSASILTWLKRRAGSAADLITDLSQSEVSEELMVVGLFKVKTSSLVQPSFSSPCCFDMKQVLRCVCTCVCMCRSWTKTTPRCSTLQPSNFLMLISLWHRVMMSSVNMVSHMMLWCCSKRYTHHTRTIMSVCFCLIIIHLLTQFSLSVTKLID